MAVKNFGKGNTEANNYALRTLPNGSRAFVMECGAGDAGAIEMKTAKEGKKGPAGTIYYASGGNSISGLVKYVGEKAGFGGGLAKELSIGFSSLDENGKIVRDFLQLPLIDEKGRIDKSSAKVLSLLEKAELGEEVTLAVFTFKHKVGEKMSEGSDKVWEKDGFDSVMSMYQAHLQSEANPNGTIKLEAADYYNQPSFYVKGQSVVNLGQGEHPPVGVDGKPAYPVIYNAEDAASFIGGVISSIKSKLSLDDKFVQATQNASSVIDDDAAFGDDDSHTVANRPRV